MEQFKQTGHTQVHGTWWDAPMSAEGPGQCHCKGTLDYLRRIGNQEKFLRMGRKQMDLYLNSGFKTEQWFLMLNPNPFHNTSHLYICKRLSRHLKNFEHPFWHDSVYLIEIFLITSETLFRKRNKWSKEVPTLIIIKLPSQHDLKPEIRDNLSCDIQKTNYAFLCLEATKAIVVTRYFHSPEATIGWNRLLLLRKLVIFIRLLP